MSSSNFKPARLCLAFDVFERKYEVLAREDAFVFSEFLLFGEQERFGWGYFFSNNVVVRAKSIFFERFFSFILSR